MRPDAWVKAHENDPRAQTPRVVAVVEERRAFGRSYGQRAAARMLADANEQVDLNERRTRAVLVGLVAIKDKIEADPLYTAKQAASDAETLRREYVRLRDALPALAVKLEQARAINADPVDYAETIFERYPLLADRLPGLPPF